VIGIQERLQSRYIALSLSTTLDEAESYSTANIHNVETITHMSCGVRAVDQGQLFG